MTVSSNAPLESRIGIARSRLRKLAAEALSVRMIGFAMSQAWIYVVLFSRGLSTQESFLSFVHSSFYELSLIALVITLVATGLAAPAVRRLLGTGVGQWIPGILCALGTLVIPYPNTGVLGEAILMAGAVTTGVGSGLLLVFWGRTYKMAGGPAAGGEAALAFALASIVQPVLVFCPIWMRVATAVALALGSSTALSLTIRRGILAPSGQEGDAVVSDDAVDSDAEIPTEAANATGPQPAYDPARGAFASLATTTGHSPESAGLSSAFVRLLASSLILGACTSIMQGFFAPPDPTAHDAMYAQAMLLASFASSALLLCTLLFSSRLDVAFTYQPVLPIIILGCFFALFLEKGSPVACTFVLMGYQLFGLINWTLLANFSFNLNIPSMRAFGLGRAALSGGVLMGHVALGLLGNLDAFTFADRTALMFCVIFAASIACTFIFTARTLAQTLRRQWLGLPPRANSLKEVLDEDGELTLDEKIDLIAREYEITGRMLEVFALIAHGRTGTRIEQELYMSKGTVKTHTRRIYRKLDVHSKQEMLDLIEEATR